jgi:hypothetical protein
MVQHLSNLQATLPQITRTRSAHNSGRLRNWRCGQNFQTDYTSNTNLNHIEENGASGALLGAEQPRQI